jgi:hypothetical protein
MDPVRKLSEFRVPWACVSLLVAAGSVQCAGLVGITDVPGGDGGLLMFDGTSGGGDRSVPGRDGSQPGIDGSHPGSDGSQPGSDGGGLALTYPPSNVGGMKFSAENTGPLVMTGDNCTIYTTYPDPPGLSCDSGMNPPQDIFGVTLPNGAGTAVVYVFTYVDIDSMSSLMVAGPNPLIIVALGSVDLRGNIDASADRFDPNAPAVPGERVSGPGLGMFNNGGPQGGGGGSFCGTGGLGATGSGALAGDSNPGAAYGTSNLIPLWGGSPGGGANTQSLDGNANGNGGGAIQISAAMSLTIESGAFITVNGSGGVSAGDESGEGGGSGGAILLEAPSVTIAGVLEANGGEGSDPNMDGASPPDDGGVATEPGCVGGNGGAAGQVNGASGGPGNGGYGGGGGAAGWIRINSGSTTVTGTVSPSLGSSCGIKGPLP